MLRDIAKDYGVSRTATSMHIARHADRDAWAEAKKMSAAARLEASEAEMGLAADAVTLARAREIASHRRWRAEREHPDVYASKPQTAVNINGNDGMSVQIVSYASPPSLPSTDE